MVSGMPEAQSDSAGRGTDGRSTRETLEQRRAGNPQGCLFDVAFIRSGGIAALRATSD